MRLPFALLIYCIFLSFQLRDHFLIGFTSQQRAWIQWRFYSALFRPPSILEQHSSLILHRMLYLLVYFLYACVAGTISWEWQRNGRSPFGSSQCGWYSGIHLSLCVALISWILNCKFCGMILSNNGQHLARLDIVKFSFFVLLATFKFCSPTLFSW